MVCWLRQRVEEGVEEVEEVEEGVEEVEGVQVVVPLCVAQ